MRIVWSPTAVQDLQHLRDYIAERNPQAATRVGRMIEEAVASLSDFPSMGRPGRIPNMRELVIAGTPFVVPYTVHQGRVEIIAVLHGAQRWPN